MKRGVFALDIKETAALSVFGASASTVSGQARATNGKDVLLAYEVAHGSTGELFLATNNAGSATWTAPGHDVGHPATGEVADYGFGIRIAVDGARHVNGGLLSVAGID